MRRTAKGGGGGSAAPGPLPVNALGDFLEERRVEIGSDRRCQLRLLREVRRREALRRPLFDAERRAVLGMRAVPDLGNLAVILFAEAEQDLVQPALLVLRGFREPLVADVGDRQQL